MLKGNQMTNGQIKGDKRTLEWDKKKDYKRDKINAQLTIF